MCKLCTFIHITLKIDTVSNQPSELIYIFNNNILIYLLNIIKYYQQVKCSNGNAVILDGTSILSTTRFTPTHP